METEPKKRISERVFDEIRRQEIERQQEVAFQDPDDRPPIPAHRRTSEDSPLAKRIVQRIQQERFAGQ